MAGSNVQQIPGFLSSEGRTWTTQLAGGGGGGEATLAGGGGEGLGVCWGRGGYPTPTGTPGTEEAVLLAAGADVPGDPAIMNTRSFLAHC